METPSTIDLMILATNIYSHYDSFDNETLILLEPKNNTLTCKLQNSYPYIDKKVLNSISFSFTLYTLWLCNLDFQHIVD